MYVPRRGKYILPNNVYLQVVYQIRDYFRLLEECQSILDESPAPPDGQPKAECQGSIVESKVLKRDRSLKIINVIDKEKENIPKEYRQGVWDNIMHGKSFPKDAGRATYSRYKSKFIYEVATKLFII